MTTEWQYRARLLVPFPIRGDRLRFALDVLEGTFGVSGRRIDGIDPERSRSRLRVLLDPTKEDLPELATLQSQIERRATLLRELLHTSPNLAATTFDLRVLSEYFHGGSYYHYWEYVAKFFTAIASDELTEEDFR